jgi:hypothetical protein
MFRKLCSLPYSQDLGSRCHSPSKVSAKRLSNFLLAES